MCTGRGISSVSGIIKCPALEQSRFQHKKKSDILYKICYTQPDEIDADVTATV